MDFIGTTARESFVGTVDDDEFDMSQGGRDTVSGLDGDDVFIFGTELNANDQIDGGADADTLILEGNYIGGVVFTATTMVGVEEIVVLGGFSYTLTLDDANSSSFGFVVDASALAAGDSIHFDGSAETDTDLVFTGGAGDDTCIGGATSQEFHLELGGSDTAIGGGSGGSYFFMEDALDSTDSLVGGVGVDFAFLTGDYSAGLTITGAMMTGIERVTFSSEFGASLVFTDDVFAAGILALITVGSSFAPLAPDIVVDLSAETDATLRLTGSLSNDVFSGGALNDQFVMSSFIEGGVDVVNGGAGDDEIEFDEGFTRDDEVDGGDGYDTLELDGDFSVGVDFRAATMADVEFLLLWDSNDYTLTLGNANVRGDGLTVDANALGASDVLIFDAGAESGSGITVLGGAAADIVITGGGDDSLLGGGGADSLAANGGDDTLDGALGRDTLFGGEGADRIDGGAAANTFVFTGVSESTGPGRDFVGVLKPLKDHFDLDVGVSAVAPRVNAGALSEATFDADMAAAIGAGQLQSGQAVVFKPNSGDLAGHFFLIVDADGLFGYQAGFDYVMEFAAGSHPNAIAVGFFI